MTKWMGVWGMAALAGTLAGCVMIDGEVVRDWESYDGPGGYQRVLGAEIGARDPEITMTVSSNGCTDKGQFEADVTHGGEHRMNVGFRRVTEDRCKALMAEGKRLTWTFAELGIPAGVQVVVLNRVGR